MDKIIINKAKLDEDGFYDICLNLVSKDASTRCNMYIYEDDIKELKKNIQLMYNLEISNFSFKYEAIGLTDNVELNFKIEKNGHVVIDYNINNENDTFISHMSMDLESLNTFSNEI